MVAIIEFSITIAESPTAVRKAQSAIPKPWLKLEVTPWILPRLILMDSIRAKLGPGDIAPSRHTSAI